MTEIKFFCPYEHEDGEQEFTLSFGELKLAVNDAKKFGGPVLVACPVCCRVSALPDDTPSENEELSEWATLFTGDNGDWISCGILDSNTIEQTRLPGGKKKVLNVVYYQPPQGVSASSPHPDGYTRREYMRIFGLDPACAMRQMVGEQKPFIVGGKR